MITLKVNGMMCEHCKKSLESALGAVSGVTSVNISLKQGTAAVQCDDTVTKEMLIKAVEDVGFEAE